MNERNAGCPAPTLLDAAAAFEAPEARLASHLEGCGACRSYITALRAERDAFIRRQPAELFERKLKARASSKARRPAWLRWAFFATAGAATAVAVLLSLPPQEIRSKGGAFKVVFRRGEAGPPKVVTPELRLKMGDALRFSYSAPETGYLLILDLDGTGRVTAFYPYDGKQAAPVRAGDSGWLPGSVVLDAAAGPEWLIAIFDTKPFEIAGLASQLTAVLPGRHPELMCGSCRIELLRIQKTP